MENSTLATRIEQLKTIRPDLANRASRAVEILNQHLANPAAGIIKARIAADGKVVYTVKGHYQTTYNTCGCPDATDPRRLGICKHQIAVRALEALIEHKHGEAVSTTAPRVSFGPAWTEQTWVAGEEWQPTGGWLSDQPRKRIERVEEV